MELHVRRRQGVIGPLWRSPRRVCTIRASFHQYRHRKPAYDWRCVSLIDAAAGYRFPIRVGHDSLRANAGVLALLRRNLQDAYASSDHAAAAAAAKQIQYWGGTVGNLKAIDTLNSGGSRFCDYLRLCDRAFGHGAGVDLAPFAHGPYKVRSNAGFTKIYSLLFSDFVIYDSRVAAGLGRLIVLDAMGQGLPCLPAGLADLVWMTGRTAARRDPSFPPYRFPYAGASAHGQHLRSNIKANWILAKMVAGTRFAKTVAAHRYFMPVTPLRALEAALFMIGYELKGNSPY